MPHVVAIALVGDTEDLRRRREHGVVARQGLQIAKLRAERNVLLRSELPSSQHDDASFCHQQTKAVDL